MSVWAKPLCIGQADGRCSSLTWSVCKRVTMANQDGVQGLNKTVIDSVPAQMGNALWRRLPEPVSQRGIASKFDRSLNELNFLTWHD